MADETVSSGQGRDFARAADLADSGDFAQALHILNGLVLTSPTVLAFRLKVGYVLREMGKLSEAEAHFRKATELRPSHHLASLGLFHSLWEQGLEEDALREAKRFTAATGSSEYREILTAANSQN